MIWHYMTIKGCYAIKHNQPTNQINFFNHLLCLKSFSVHKQMSCVLFKKFTNELFL